MRQPFFFYDDFHAPVPLPALFSETHPSPDQSIQADDAVPSGISTTALYLVFVV